MCNDSLLLKCIKAGIFFYYRSQHFEKLEVKYVEDPDELKLKKNVLLAFTDTCAGGR